MWTCAASATARTFVGKEALTPLKTASRQTVGAVLSAQHGLSYRYIELHDFVMLKKSLLLVIVPFSFMALGEECREGLSTVVERCL